MKHNIIFNSGTGKIGNMVGYVRGGIQMFRAYQPVVNNPKTARQTLSREKLAVASDLSRALGRALRIGFGNFASSRVSARNIFTKEIIPVGAGVIEGTSWDNVSVDYEKLPISKGNLPVGECSFGELDCTTPSRVKVSLEEATHAYGTNHVSTGDEVDVTLNIVILNTVKNETILNTVMYYTKATGTWHPLTEIVTNVPQVWAGEQVQVYAFLKQHPDAINGIAGSTAPYRYPGEAGETYYVGHAVCS